MTILKFQQTNFYRVEVATPWNHWGEILVQGYIEDFLCDETDVTLYRTGPFVPPITLPILHVIVTEEAKAHVLSSFPYARAFPLKRVHAVHSSWYLRLNDASMSEQIQNPDFDETEARHIATSAHDVATAAVMPTLWCLRLPIGAKSKLVPTNDRFGNEELAIVMRTWQGHDFFWTTPARFRIPIVTDRGRDVLSRIDSTWISFTPLAVI